MKIILTHANADFDAVAASLAAYKLNPDSVPVLPQRLNRNVRSFLTLYGHGLPYIYETDLPNNTPIEQVILVDTQRLPPLQAITSSTAVQTIDHHQPFSRTDLRPNETFESHELGAVTTLLVERIQQQGVALTALEATLLALGIYEDTGSLAYGTTTYRDIQAAAWLLQQQAVLDTVRRFLFPPLNEDQQTLYETLLHAADSRIIQGHSIIVSTATISEPISEISSVVHRLRDLLDPAVLIVLVQMPDSLLMVCRATREALDVGEIARHYGGGGHDRAAAATIYDKKLATVLPDVWQQIHQHTQPMARVADLMSLGVQTFNATQQVNEVAQQIRRIGHEGYPVLQNQRVVGLLTRREVDRALEHQLGNMTINEIMVAGTIQLRPDTSVYELEQTMVSSGWGQIPVVDDQGDLLGIVTRTDLIKHWVSAHPTQPEPAPAIPQTQINEVLGAPVANLIQHITQQAQAANLSVYLVGGVVRDLVLQRANFDIDFVIEGDALAFAQQLQHTYGGDLHLYRPFGTAKWLLDETLSPKLAHADLPAHIDLATARNEFYEHPTALPTVYQSSIKLDLQRRDFTINTLALQISPAAVESRLLDFYGGLNDLHNKLIRVLHSLSFVDDPTRILRAHRFAGRLHFTLEARTSELIQTALPMLGRITGERVRHELDLILAEPQAARILHTLESASILQAIHPAFTLPHKTEQHFGQADQQSPIWFSDQPDVIDLRWHILAATWSPEDVLALDARLHFARKTAQALAATSRLMHMGTLNQPDLKPSAVARLLSAYTDTTLFTVWLLNPDASALRQHIEHYQRAWKHIHASTTGRDLQAQGVRPGPIYQRILSRLRDARLDGLISTDQEEAHLLHQIIQEEALRDE